MNPPQVEQSPRARLRGEHLVIGIDVGSTTVKSCVVDPDSREILWADYQRHETRQAEKVLEQLVAIGDAFQDIPTENIRTFITGSGAGPLRAPIGSKFVQEVNAVTMAVDQLHPDAGSVIELGGQDAKIIIYKQSEEKGDKRAVASMNDKCASGTGATIDKCLIKVGMESAQIGNLAWDDRKLHHVAAKCGVFCRNRYRQLGQVGHPLPRDHVLPGGRYRHAEPLGAHSRQYAQGEGTASGGPQHLPPLFAGLLAAAYS